MCSCWPEVEVARSGQKAAYRVHSQVPEDEVARGRIGQRLKWPEVEVARGRGGQGTKWPEDEVAKGRSGQRTKWPGDEVARGRSGQGTKWPEFKVARVRSGQRCCDWLRKRAALVLPQPISSRARRRRHWTLPPQQGRIQATYLGRSRQCHDVSHLSRLRVGEGSVGRFRRCRAVLRAAVGVGAGREGGLWIRRYCVTSAGGGGRCRGAPPYRGLPARRHRLSPGGWSAIRCQDRRGGEGWGLTQLDRNYSESRDRGRTVGGCCLLFSPPVALE